LQRAASELSEAGRGSEAKSLRRRPGKVAGDLASRKFSPRRAVGNDREPGAASVLHREAHVAERWKHQPCSPSLGGTAAIRVSDRIRPPSNRLLTAEEIRSRPVSRVLSRAIIHLGPTSPSASSDLPGSPRGRRFGALRHRALPYLVLLRVGFTMPRRVATRAVRSYRTISPLPRAEARGGIFSVALSVGSRPPGVTWHPVRRSPDFPPDLAVGRLPGRLQIQP